MSDLLETMLHNLIDLARGSHGNDIHNKLKGGLHIWVRYYDEKKVFRLSIGRQKVEPSFREWNTLIARWPWRVIANPAKSQDEHGINFYLSAYIPDRAGASNE